jgi:hypothetical protein
MKLTYWDCIWVIFEQPERQSEHSLGFHQIHTLPTEWRAKGDLCKHKPRPFWTSLLTTCSICDFLLFPELKTALQERILISPCSRTITVCTFSASNSLLHKMLCPVAWSQCLLLRVCYDEIIQPRNHLSAPFTEWMFGIDIMQGMKMTIHIHLVLQITKKWDISFITLNEHLESFIITKLVNGNIKKPYRISILNCFHSICLYW